MPAGDYEYRGMMASAWDLLRGDYAAWPDRPFYRDVISRAGQPALDIGCGTGRLILDYLASGLDVDGVDDSPEMLDICRAKALDLGLTPALYEQPMQSLDLPRRYRTIFVPSSSFLLLTDKTDAAEAMRRFYEHLLPGGVLVMPFMFLWPGHRPSADGEWSAWYVSGERQRPEDGATVRRRQRARYHLDEQLEDTEDRYELLVNGKVIATEEHQRSPAGRWYDREQSLAAHTSAGFADVHAVHEFTFEPASAEDRIWTVFGTRPE
jgi:SAM-dependent methyltransferase